MIGWMGTFDVSLTSAISVVPGREFSFVLFSVLFLGVFFGARGKEGVDWTLFQSD